MLMRQTFLCLVRFVEGVMSCLSCKSANEAELTAEMMIHFSGTGFGT
jgi:hypothetical protein